MVWKIICDRNGRLEIETMQLDFKIVKRKFKENVYNLRNGIYSYASNIDI